MNKIQLKLVEDEEIITPETNEETENTEDVATEDQIEEVETPEEIKFIDSDELNEMREVLLDIPDEIELLLLNDELIVMGSVVDQETFLYTLPDECDDFVLIKMPMDIEEIKANKDIIKYTTDAVDPRHNKIMDILMKKLTPDKVNDTKEDDEDVKED